MDRNNSTQGKPQKSYFYNAIKALSPPYSSLMAALDLNLSGNWFWQFFSPPIVCTKRAIFLANISSNQWRPQNLTWYVDMLNIFFFYRSDKKNLLNGPLPPPTPIHVIYQRFCLALFWGCRQKIQYNMFQTPHRLSSFVETIFRLNKIFSFAFLSVAPGLH